jgi:hypothetical protein
LSNGREAATLSTMSAMDELSARHRAFSAAPLPTLTQQLTARPRMRVVVLTAFAGFAGFDDLDDLDTGLRAGVQRLRDCPWLPPRDRTRGFVYDTTAHRITERVPLDAVL